MQQGVQVLHGGDTLSAGATTLALRSSRAKMTHPELMTLLNVATASLGYERPKYDFVYMPWAKLAFVNFQDHHSCQAYFEIFQNVCRLGLDHPGISAVAEAYVQGLADNLAFFVSKCGWEAINDVRAPLVFESGEPVMLLDAINQHVTAQLLQENERRLQSSSERTSDHGDQRNQGRWRAVAPSQGFVSELSGFFPGLRPNARVSNSADDMASPSGMVFQL